MNKKIIGAILSYNHSKTIEDTYNRVDKKIFDEIIIFDDNSKDNTVEIALKIGCKVIQNKTNLGHGGNLKKVLNYCFNNGADFVVEIHGDGQYEPNTIKDHLDKLHNNNDLIVGSRFVNKNPFKSDGMPFIRYVTNLIFSKITSTFLDINLTEFHTGYKIFGKKFHDIVPYEKCSNNYLFSFQVILQAKFFNLSINEISITSKYDEDSTSCNYFNGFLYLMGNIKYILLFLLAKISLVKNEIFIAKN